MGIREAIESFGEQPFQVHVDLDRYSFESFERSIVGQILAMYGECIHVG